MPRILVNPSNAQCLDYLLDIYHAVRAPFVTPESTHQQAAAILTTVWEAQNTVEKQQWQQQVDCDVEEAEERREMAECQVREIYGGNSGNSGRQVWTYEMSEGTSASAYVLRPFQTLVPRFRNGKIGDRKIRVSIGVVLRVETRG